MYAKKQTRRDVLVWGGAAASVVVAGAVLPNFGIGEALAADLGAGDIGVLNYAYALEQLEAAFYTQVLNNPYGGRARHELEVLSQIRDHEVDHRNFLQNALGRNAIPNLEVDFSRINFDSRTSVLGTADTFENLGIAAYNGAGHLLRKVAYLAAAGSIVSVEARHAAAIAELRHGASAASVGAGHVNGKGLDAALPPRAVLPKVKPFVRTPVTAMSL